MISIKIEKEDLKSTEKGIMNPKKTSDILRKSINEIAKRTRKDLLLEAQKKYMIRTARFNKAIKIERASSRNLRAVIRVKGTVLELRDFKVTPNRYAKGKNRPSSIRGQVLKSGSPKALEVGGVKAFVAKFKSGHIAVVQRVPGKRMKSNPSKEFLKKLLSPSIPKMLGNEESIDKIIRMHSEDYVKDTIESYIGNE